MVLVVLGYKFKCKSMDEAMTFVCRFLDKELDRIFLMDNGKRKSLKVCFE